MKTAAILVLLATTPALADESTVVELVPTCVEIDPALDEMPYAESVTARLLLVRALEQAEQLIVEIGCADTIRLSHQKEGALVNIRIGNGRAQETMLVSAKADMRETYKSMVAALLAPPPPIPEPVVDAEPTPLYPSEQAEVDAAAPEADGDVRVKQFYTRFGAASLAGRSSTMLSFGWRRGGAHVVDLGFSTVLSDEAGRGVASVALRLQTLEYTSAADRSSPYWGGGLSLASTKLEQMGLPTQSGGGMQLDGTIGYEWNRRGSVPISVEANLGLPLYEIGDIYPATFVASFGIAM